MKSLKLRNLTLGLLITVLFFTLLYGVFFYTHISKIVVESSGKDHFVAGLEELKGANILFLDTTTYENKIRASNPYVRSVHLSKIYPQTINVKLAYYKPLALLKVTDGYYLLSKDATVLSKTHSLPAQKYPIITFYQNFEFNAFQSGAYLDYEEIVSSIFFLQKALDLNLSIDNIDINGLHMILFTLDNKKTLFFTTGRELDRQVYELQSIVKDLKIQGRDYQELDFRYDKPIIRGLTP